MIWLIVVRMATEFMAFYNNVIMHSFYVALDKSDYLVGEYPRGPMDYQQWHRPSVVLILPEDIAMQFSPLTSKGNFESAKGLCKHDGMKLAIMKVPADLKVFYGEFGSTFNGVCLWVGLQYNEEKKVFLWRDGVEENLSWTAWMDNEPDCYEKHSKCSAVEHCVAMDLTGNYKRDTVFRTVSCTNEECLVICEKETSDPSSTTSLNPVKTETSIFASNTYRISSTTTHPLTSIPTLLSSSTLTTTNTLDKSITTSTDVLTTEMEWYLVTDTTYSYSTTPVTSLTEAIATSSIFEQSLTSYINQTTVKPDRISSEPISWQGVDQVSYHFFNDTKITFSEARKLCNEHQMDLPIVKTTAALEKFQEFMNYLYDNQFAETGVFWIGIIWNEKIGKHTWLDLQPVLEDYWYPGQPICMSGPVSTLWKCNNEVRDCAAIRTDALLRSRSCQSERRVICQKKTYSTRPKILNCKCPQRGINQKWHYLDGANKTETEVAKEVKEDFQVNIEKNITVEKKNVSKSIRKRICAHDDRPVSQSIGGTAVIFVGIPIVLVIVLDTIKLANAFLFRK